MKGFFADTYAILAVLAGDAAYARRFRGASFRTGPLNLYEAYAAQLALEVPPAEIEFNLAPFEAALLPLEWPLLRRAARLRRELGARRRRLTYADAAGYAQALDADLSFLTGDDVFRGLDHVEFLPAARSRP